MKLTTCILSALCAAAVLFSALPAAAQAPAAAPTRATAVKKPLTSMQHAFEGVNWATDKKPNLRAQYYIYLMSASWCGPCRALMPRIVEAYKTDMKEGKYVEVILTACEQTRAGVPAYLEKYGAGFPGIHISHPDVAGFIGFDKNDIKKGIPFVTICDNEGNVLAKGNGAFNTWKETIQKHKAAKKAAK